MNILLSTDDNFVQHCCVTMASVLENNKGVTFYLLTAGLKPENYKLLTNFVEAHNGILQICKVDDNITNRFPMPKEGGEHISIATYYRLFAQKVLPSDADRVIYIDCDIVVRGSLEPLWKIDIDNYALGAVYQGMNSLTKDDFERLGIPKEMGYFNAGVLLINLDYWRKHQVTERLFDYIKNNFHKIKQHDQDTLNAVLYNEVKPVSYAWNYLPQFFLVKKGLTFPARVDYSEKIDPIVIHYVSIPKPWDYGCYNPYTNEYFKYLDHTPFKGWRPPFIWKKYKQQVLIPKMIKILTKIDFLRLRRFLRQ